MLYVTSFAHMVYLPGRLNHTINTSQNPAEWHYQTVKAMHVQYHPQPHWLAPLPTVGCCA
jgi:hypothetical protein